LHLQRHLGRHACRIPRESRVLATTLPNCNLIWDIFFRPLRKCIGGGINAFPVDFSASVATARLACAFLTCLSKQHWLFQDYYHPGRLSSHLMCLFRHVLQPSFDFDFRWVLRPLRVPLGLVSLSISLAADRKSHSTSSQGTGISRCRGRLAGVSAVILVVGWILCRTERYFTTDRDIH
jgi:hypothetical protein